MPSQSPSKTYDLIVVGSGPAGQRAAVQAAKLGKKTILIERGEMGGSCLFTGTIPSKTLREAALFSKGKTGKALFAEVMDRLNSVIASENEVIQNQLKRNGVDCLTGTAEFKSASEITVRMGAHATPVHGHHIILATGTYPTRPEGVEFDALTMFDSDSILRIKSLPKTLAIIGAGVIGCEYASIFANLGVQVTLFDRRTSLLRGIDTEILKALTERFSKQGIELVMGAEIENVQRAEVKLKAFSPRKFEVLLYCMGRTGNVNELNMAKAGVKVGERGIIPVNSAYQTNVAHIFAVGDVIGPPGLAASASEQGRIAANYIFTKEKLEFPKTFPYGIYTIPEISNVGAQEEDLNKMGTPFVVGRAFYRELARGKILGDDLGFLKLLIHRQTREILGVHIIGSQATELIHIGQVAMALKGKIDFLVENVFNYPTLAEAYKVAAYNAYNQLR